VCVFCIVTVVKVYMFCIVIVLRVNVLYCDSGKSVHVLYLIVLRVCVVYCDGGKSVHVWYCDSGACECFVL
jgi:hypothetical protein